MKFLEQVRAYAQKEMSSVSHGWPHIQRVSANARRLSEGDNSIDQEVLVYAALLHDIGRSEGQGDHAVVGSDKARTFLQSIDVPEKVINGVCHAIVSHRFRGSTKPETVEARILFDADKLDAMGMIGAARAVAYAAEHRQPIYMPLEEARRKGLHPANMEFDVKLRHLPKIMLTEKGKIQAMDRLATMELFFNVLEAECDE